MMPDLREISIEDYLAAQVSLECGTVPLFRWDNYLSIHLAIFEKNVSILRSMDRGDGDDPRHPCTFRSRPDELPENLSCWLKTAQSPWIINIDLDYFFCSAPDSNDAGEENWLPMFSEEFIETVFGQIKKALDANLVGCVTVCLTPSNFTPGWEECLDLSRKIFKILDAVHPYI